MNRFLCLVCLLVLISIRLSGQCTNSPTITLVSSSGTVCNLTPITVSGNTFGGSAKKITITENGSGSVSPTSVSKSPFSFTYTPKSGDIGKKVEITFTSDNPPGPCSAAKTSYILTVSSNPSAPQIGTITKPTCLNPTGSVVLNGLPAGAWSVTQNPGGIIINGTGVTTTITNVAAGSFTFTTTNPDGCTSSASATAVIPAQQGAPATPTQTAECSSASGQTTVSVTSPVGTGLTYSMDSGSFQSSTSFTGIANGSHSITVRNASGCSATGPTFQIACGCAIAAPGIGTITPPTCISQGGSVQLTGLPASGTWTLTRYPGTITSTGSGGEIILTGLPSGIYNFIVTGSGGCVSSMSANAIIPANQDMPSSPLIGTVVQPHKGLSTGSVVLNGLPATGSWSILRSPDNVITSGTGITSTISGLIPGTYKFRITNSAGCTSVYSDDLVIKPTAGNPIVVITNPSPVCFPSTINLTDPKITAGSTPDLTYTYWKDVDGKISFKGPLITTSGIFYIKGMSRDSSFDIQPVTATVFHMPVANAGTDQVLINQTETTMNAEVIQNYETGVWSEISGSGSFFDSNYPKTAVTGLSPEKNVFAWTVTNGICPPSTDTVTITVHNHLLPTLITPNMDGRNDYFVLKGISPLSRIELVVFDRRGNMVYRNLNYDNLWNGIDLNGNPLPDDTYFYVIKTEAAVSLNGYVVIKR